MKKSKSTAFLEDIFEPLSMDSIKLAFQKKLVEFGLDAKLAVEDVALEEEGIILSLIDDEDNAYTVLFTYEEESGARAFPVTDADEKDDDEAADVEFDLDPYNPVIVQTAVGSYMNLADLSWLDLEIFVSLLAMAGMDICAAKLPMPKYDEFGNFLKNEAMNEIFVTRVVGGKKMRVQAIRRVRKRRLTAKQRAGIRKAVQKRRAEKSQIARHRKASIRVRKRLHLKPSHLPKGFRVRR